MPAKIIFCLLFFLILVSSPVSAQTLTPVPAQIASEGEVLGIFDSLIGFLMGLLAEKEVPEGVRNYNERTNPVIAEDPLPDDPDNQENADLLEAAYQYSRADSASTPEETVNDKQTFFAGILAFFKNLFDGLFTEGNEDAENFASAKLPPNVAGEIIAGSMKSSPLASADSDVLALQASDQAMAYALDVAKCAELPLALCPGEFGGTDPEISPTPDDEPTPTPEEGWEPPEDGKIPAVCLQQPTCFDGNRTDCYQNMSISSCWIITKGWCSEECLEPYFTGDKDAAKKASMICWRESGGNPKIANRGCETGKSVDYSIGLFQINLLAHCPAAEPHYTWEPPSCWFENPAERDLCDKNFQDPITNIKYGSKLSVNGTYWHPWAASREAYCDIDK
ncbi:MAG: hypothetical protein UV73_C0018G0006 [Candidatus Gottesmanbacteria bacterium GW2011_GWA2_43_14]|uniref:Uncharacterized protein n=1 Tax=Candidatus Gottesmanbacteria bacterium GW2011_GWA2_43_14 TaxID=1618443 RepID=A0A0G1G8V2_9BACT|nr:MAG: hypothetical protein UV73_C0018G0006 [Candidatus Gottesmanbacteria bacterium GW2011_GWA2_43_14]